MKTFTKDMANILAPMPIKRDLGYGQNAPGEIFLANSSRFSEAEYSEPLTTYAVSWTDAGGGNGESIKDTLEFIAPAVSGVPRKFEFSRFNNAEAFMSETDDVRAIGQNFGLVEYTSEKQLARVVNKGLGIRVDDDNVEDQPMWRERYTGMLMERLMRNELRRAFTYLLASATQTAKTWSTGAVDPDQDLRKAVEAYAGDGTTSNGAGIYPNRAIIGASAWVARQGIFRAQNTAGAYASAAMTEDEVAKMLMLDEVRVSKERYQSANATPMKKPILGQYALIFLAKKGASPFDPSNIKRFVSSTDGGTPFRVYEQRLNAHTVEISVEHYSNIIITGNIGIQALVIS